jgi:uncharacterized protein YjbI with pentapeptide repeats
MSRLIASVRRAFLPRDLSRADLTGAHLERADIAFAVVNEASLDDAHPEEAILAGSHFSDTSFRGAHLERSNVIMTRFGWEVSLDGVPLEGAMADGSTVWPEGFDPVAAGVVFRS